MMGGQGCGGTQVQAVRKGKGVVESICMEILLHCIVREMISCPVYSSQMRTFLRVSDKLFVTHRALRL